MVLRHQWAAHVPGPLSAVILALPLENCLARALDCKGENRPHGSGTLPPALQAVVIFQKNLCLPGGKILPFIAAEIFIFY